LLTDAALAQGLTIPQGTHKDEEGGIVNTNLKTNLTNEKKSYEV
jgi:hypothetical protein